MMQKCQAFDYGFELETYRVLHEFEDKTMPLVNPNDDNDASIMDDTRIKLFEKITKLPIEVFSISFLFVPQDNNQKSCRIAFRMSIDNEIETNNVRIAELCNYFVPIVQGYCHLIIANFGKNYAVLA